MKKALIVGIDHYSKSIVPLNSAVNDALKIDKLLSTNYSCNGETLKNFSCRTLVSTDDPKKQITRAILLKEIHDLFRDDKMDMALLYFSGHGYENSLGGYLVTQDAKQYEEGVSFNDIMIYANNSKIREIIIILDCCMSGDIGNLAIPNIQQSNIKNGISILTSSTKGEMSHGRNGSGLFTNIICNALKGGNSDILGNVKISHLYEHADRMLGPWEQRPTFKTNSNRLSVIRKTEPKLAPAILKLITNYFPYQEYQYPLNKSFEPTEKQGNEKNETIFKNLQKMMHCGIVRPYGAEHMYYAAINEKHCVLTEKGKQYWALVQKDLIP